MRRLEGLNESFAKGVISWAEWSEETEPILRTLNPELHVPRSVVAQREGVDFTEAPAECVLDESRVLEAV